MAKIKFNPSVNPLNKEHYGFTFQRNNYGFSMFPAGKNDRKRYTLQWEKMNYMSKAIRNWRDMSIETKNAWNVFAATYPQPTEKDPNTFLTGYQLFLKRNFYRFLHEGINFDFLLEPELTELPDPDFTISIIEDGLCVDVTEEYIRNHGILPEVGQFIICRVIPIATNSGQFFAPFIATLEVQEVYIDGLVCSFNFPNVVENIVFSLYMSKPVYESVQYAGTKFRYMGCFKPTKFIQLTDTPDSYEGEAGKIVKVKDDETGLEFGEESGCEVCPPVPGEGDAGKVITVNPEGTGYELAEGGGGGFDCDDLLNCSIIQSILNQIENIGSIVSEEFNTSIPPISFGLLYNYYCFLDSRGMFQPGWSLPTYANWNSLRTYLGGSPAGSLKMMEPNSDYWISLVAGVTNEMQFNARGAGWAVGQTGTYNGLKNHGYMHLADIRPGLDSYYAYFRNYDGRWYTGILLDGKLHRMSYRICRPAPGKPDLSVGQYIGNNGIIYRTVVINGYEYLADNLAETMFNNGDPIPKVNYAYEHSTAQTPFYSAPDYDDNLI